MEINIRQTVKTKILSSQKIRQAVITVLKELKKDKLELSVTLIGDKKMKALNNLYRGKNQTTDVLSFSTDKHPQIGHDDWGDIFISIPQILRQAKELKVPAKEELIRMLVHGVLHLAGYDHEKKQPAKIMFDLQEKLVKNIYEN